MGRQKQTTPLQRNPSSQMMHTLPDEPELAQKHPNGAAIAHSATNGKASASDAVAPEPVADNPGLVQLLICVLGIYAAL